MDGDDPTNWIPRHVQLFRHLPRSRSAERGPVFADTRVPIQALFDYVEAGHALAEFLGDFPTVTQAQALAVLKHSEGGRSVRCDFFWMSASPGGWRGSLSDTRC